MIIRILKYTYFLVACASLLSCEDIISVTDISDDSIHLISPIDEVILDSSSPVNFIWLRVEASDFYEVQINRRITNELTESVLDTLITDTIGSSVAFSKSLSEGIYIWNVKAINSDFQTELSSAGFSIESQIDDDEIVDANVVLLAPADEQVLTLNDITFSWENVQVASSYQIQVADPNFLDAIQIIEDSTTTNTTTTFQIQDGLYEWRVKAINEFGESLYTTHILEVDTTPNLSEENVIILSPLDGSSLDGTTVDFSWELIAEATLYRVIVTDTATDLIVDEFTTSTSPNSLTLESGSYSWKIRAENSTQNSPFTEASFTVL